MKSSYLTNLVLLVIVIALLWISQRDEPAEDSPRISAMTAESVKQIQIQRLNKPTLTLQHNQDSWSLVEPFKADANQTRVNLLLSLLSAPIHGQFKPMEQSSLQQFGLNQPTVMLSMNNEQFVFGSVESLSHKRYVMHQGMIYLVQDDVTPLLTASPGSFVDNRLIADNQSITRLRVPTQLNSDESLDIRQEDGHWRSDNKELGSDTLKTLIDSWQHAYAMQVHYLPADKLATLPEPQVTLWLQDQTEPRSYILTQQGQTLQLINPKTQLQYDFPMALQSQLLPPTQQP